MHLCASVSMRALLRPLQLLRLPTSMQPVRQMSMLTGAAIGKMKTVTVSRCAHCPRTARNAT